MIVSSPMAAGAAFWRALAAMCWCLRTGSHSTLLQGAYWAELKCAKLGSAVLQGKGDAIAGEMERAHQQGWVLFAGS